MEERKNPTPEREHPDYEERAIQRLLESTPETHRPEVLRFVTTKRNQGKKTGTIENYMRWLEKWCRWAPVPLKEANAGHVTAYFEDLRNRGYQRAMVSQAAVLTKAFYAWLLMDEERPKSFWASFPTAAPKAGPGPRPLTAEELSRLMLAARSVRDRVLLGVLIDSGMRISEVLALNVGSLTFEDAHGTAWLSLPADGKRLKTGARSIPVKECAPLLRDWLHIHHRRTDPTAPLFYAQTRRSAFERLTREQAYKILERCGERGNVPRVHPHLFRHGRATLAAKMRWNEELMRRYFGWAPGSKMTSKYVHLSDEDVRAQVLQDTAPVAQDEPDGISSGPPQSSVRGNIGRRVKTSQHESNPPGGTGLGHPPLRRESFAGRDPSLPVCKRRGERNIQVNAARLMRGTSQSYSFAICRSAP